MGTNSWKPQTDMADALSYTMTTANTAPPTPPMTATQAQAAMANGQSLTAGMMQQAYQTQLGPMQPGMYQQWFTGTSGVSGTPGMTPWNVVTTNQPENVTKEEWEAFKKEVMEEIDDKLFDLHNKLDKMYEILQGLVKVEIPTDEIQKALGVATDPNDPQHT